jgi:hypothetical protein
VNWKKIYFKKYTEKNEKELLSFLKDITMKVMESSYSQVIERILSQAMCPRCGSPVSDCGYDVLMVDSERMILELDCENCESILTVNGVFQRKQNKKVYSQKKIAMVSPETVRGVGQVLRGFHCGDVQDLLKK